MENVFLSNKGLTSTEANHYANMAKEISEESAKYLANLQLYDVYIESLSGTSKKLMSKGTNDLSKITESIELISRMNTFCAWIREAIKAKEQMLSNLDSISLEDWAKNNNVELPEMPEHVPTLTLPTEKDIIDEWSAEKRLKYLRLEAHASTIGKYIHPNGSISKARENYHEAATNPIRKEVLASDVILYSHNITLSNAVIESMFMLLQNNHRTFEKELNAMKAEVKSELNKRILEANQKHKDNINKFNDAYTAYTTERGKITTEFNNWKTIEQERISKLRISLPQDISNILDNIKEKIGE